MHDATDPHGARDLAGKPFGEYLILRRLGSGGMADVYLAMQESLDRQVAIKVLKSDLADDESYVLRFANEARSVASLTHQNIVQVFEVGQVEGKHYIAQEYVPGRNLKQRLTRCASLPIAEAIAIIRAVTSALARSAETGIVHRDIKPENILLGDDGEVKVADFGLARRDHDRTELELTQIGMTVGTPLYMSPEQIRGGKVTAKSDMYSLGVTAYHMLAGYPPFDADTPLNVAMKHVNDSAPLLSDVRPDVQISLAKIVARMMEKDPQNRFENFGQVVEELDRLDVPTSGSSAGGLGRVHLRSGSSRPLMPETHELAAAIGSKPASPQKFRWPRLVVAGLLGAITALSLVAIRGGLDPLALRAGESLPKVERKETARAQHAFAMLMNTEEAWQAVYGYFPPDGETGGSRQRYYALNAKRQLARLYLESDKIREAMPICAELAALDATDETLRAFGMAGQAIAHYRLGEMEKAASMLSSLEGYRDVVDSSLRDEIVRIHRALRND